MTGPGLPRPWLGPGLLLWPFVQLWGIEDGLRLFAAAASVLPVAAVWLLAKRLLGDQPAVWVASIGAALDLWLSLIHI